MAGFTPLVSEREFQSETGIGHFQSRVVSAEPSESAVAPATIPAAAELDQNCYAIFGTQTVLAESPGMVASAKHGPIDSEGTALTTLLSRLKNLHYDIDQVSRLVVLSAPE